MSEEVEKSAKDQDKEVLGYIEHSLSLIDELKAENAGLTQKMAELTTDKVTLEKVASDKSPLFTDEELEQAVDRLVDLSFVNRDSRDKVANVLKGDNRSVLNLLKDVSEAGLTSVSTGDGIAKEASETSGDPDGWTRLSELGIKK